jgi:branched-chain amino acid transport system substrate-binding protein
MKAHNVKTVGYIGYSDSYGDLWFKDLKDQTAQGPDRRADR